MPEIPAGGGSPAPPTLTITLDDVAAHLNDTSTWSAAKETEVQHFLDAAIAYVTRYLGAFIADTYTDTVTVRGSSLLLPRIPVVSVTSIAGITNTTTSGLAYVTADVLVDSIGILTLASGSAWTAGRYTVTYTAGYETIPEDLRLAVLELVRVNYVQTQHGGRPTGDIGEGGPRLGFFAPGRVTELLDQYRVPAVA